MEKLQKDVSEISTLFRDVSTLVKVGLIVAATQGAYAWITPRKVLQPQAEQLSLIDEGTVEVAANAKDGLRELRKATRSLARSVRSGAHASIRHARNGASPRVPNDGCAAVTVCLIAGSDHQGE